MFAIQSLMLTLAQAVPVEPFGPVEQNHSGEWVMLAVIALVLLAGIGGLRYGFDRRRRARETRRGSL